MKHIAQVEIKQTSRGIKYIYRVNEKVVRTSTRKYVVSTADGEYFSSRIDLLHKNAQYQQDLQYAIHRAELTKKQYIAEQEEKKARLTKDFNKYNNENNKEKWVNDMVNILFLFGNVPTQEEVEQERNASIEKWNKWAQQAKERLEIQLHHMQDKVAMTKEYYEIREQGRKRLHALEIVTYTF